MNPQSFPAPLPLVVSADNAPARRFTHEERHLVLTGSSPPATRVPRSGGHSGDPCGSFAAAIEAAGAIGSLAPKQSGGSLDVITLPIIGSRSGSAPFDERKSTAIVHPGPRIT